MHASPLLSVREPYWVTQKWSDTLNPLGEGALGPAAAGGFPRRMARKNVSPAEVDELVQRNVENLRWATLQNLESAFRRFAGWFDDRLGESGRGNTRGDRCGFSQAAGACRPGTGRARPTAESGRNAGGYPSGPFGSSKRGAGELASIVTLPLAPDIQRALERLKSLHDGDLGVLEIVACGRRAIPALRALLLEGEFSGIDHPRCRAVEALAALSAHDVLIEFLSAPRDVADPVNRTGEEAVINTAARALAASCDVARFSPASAAGKTPAAGRRDRCARVLPASRVDTVSNKSALGRLQPASDRSRPPAAGAESPKRIAEGGNAACPVGRVGNPIELPGAAQRCPAIGTARRFAPSATAGSRSDG